MSSVPPSSSTVTSSSLLIFPSIISLVFFLPILLTLNLSIHLEASNCIIRQYGLSPKLFLQLEKEISWVLMILFSGTRSRGRIKLPPVPYNCWNGPKLSWKPYQMLLWLPLPLPNICDPSLPPSHLPVSRVTLAPLSEGHSKEYIIAALPGACCCCSA